ncbi:MAG: inorganic phosphate transporter [Deltaproteobacteria bacterium]|nr:MAG: inorganic phosphate transporter [Deltaproteobacteria bacterium]UCH20430.1 MAG: inorganic phosphate transporter [Deltaproteobacteria bacterium]
MLAYVIFIIIVALLFDFLNGMNDAANSIATIVSTRVLSPRLAVLWAAFFNLIAAFFFGVHVATTIGKGVVDPAIVDAVVILATLLAAILWTAVCTQLGLPISVSHALVGGLVGTGAAKAGLGALVWQGLIKIAIFIGLAPLIGTFLGYFSMVAVYWMCHRCSPQVVDRWFRRLQLASAAAFSLGHGTNDAQKTMGIIAILLFSTGYMKGGFHVPFWIVISCHVAIALGTLAGGWRVIETVGMKMTKLRSVHGFCAETAAACSILLSTVGGIPVSTTHTITGAIIGVGATTKLSAIRWGVAYRIVWAWLLTIPGTALVAALIWHLLQFIPLPSG